jgi:phospholipid/cholesterol/gamma-HCH transport system substrate-binding protein
MSSCRLLRRTLPIALCVVVFSAGCAFHGINSLALPGAQGRGRGDNVYHVETANVGTLESNSPVLMSDVVVGSVGRMRIKARHADVEVWVKRGVAVPDNVVATIGQTSLLGSMHVALNPPPGQAPHGRLPSGVTIPLNRSSIFPSTEQTLSWLSVVINSGGLGQIGDVVHNFSTALSGHETQLRELLTRLDEFVGVLDRQRGKIIESIEALNRLAGTFASQRNVIDEALRKIPPALDVLIRERPRLTTALDKLHDFSTTTTRLVHDTQADLVRNLHNLKPTLQALADVGPDLSTLLAYVPTFPFTQNFLDRSLRGDYFNVFAIIDFTLPRLKRSVFLGTRWGDPNAPLGSAPGDPYFLNYKLNPLSPPPITPPPAAPPPPGAPLGNASPPPAPDLSPIAPIDLPDSDHSHGGH